MLAKACQQGHVDIVKLLVLNYKADTENCAIRSNDFAVITGVPLYAAAKAGMVNTSGKTSTLNGTLAFNKQCFH